MAAMWFLVFFLLLATASSLAVAELQETDELHQKQSGIHLNIYHVQGPGASLSPKSPSRDEERLKVLHSRVANKDASKKSFSIPVRPGFSIDYAGSYYVKIGLGTPAKYYAMVIDTGSSFSWVQCQPCSIYCHPQAGPFFDPSSSTTYKNLSCATRQCSSLDNSAHSISHHFCDHPSDPCVYRQGYGDQSASLGYLSQDLLTLTPSQTLPRFVFGCGEYNQGLFGKTDGILGLGRQPYSMISQLSTKYGHAFSYCLPTDASTKGGFLSIGNSSLAAFSAYNSTPITMPDTDFYYLKLKAITVAGRQLAGVEYDQFATIIDSGSEHTHLPESVYNALGRAFVKIMSKKYELVGDPTDACFKGSLKSMSEVPKIQLIFQGGADLTLKTPNVLGDFGYNITCLAFVPASQPLAIIGSYQQQTFGVAYDVSNSRLKFAPGFCS